MQAYKLNATIDESGNLIIHEPLNIAPGTVEVIILQPVPSLESSRENQIQSQPEKQKKNSGMLYTYFERVVRKYRADSFRF
ncbi:hypothetical protein [Nostoc sp. FACHB-888]|uniref:hypothetical protein n=1 Tax=Nostoc sp. FACHB-888 TaxID=2692842 RepID=UPI001F54FE05|nr:hypothetical protein [Nostoc sp. FACHB-888]